MISVFIHLLLLLSFCLSPLILKINKIFYELVDTVKGIYWLKYAFDLHLVLKFVATI